MGMTDEELAQWLDGWIVTWGSSLGDSEQANLTEIADRLRKLQRDRPLPDSEIQCPQCKGRGSLPTQFKCCIDGEDDPDDTCVLDHGRPNDCFFGHAALAAGGKHMCKEWRQIPTTSIDKAMEKKG